MKSFLVLLKDFPDYLLENIPHVATVLGELQMSSVSIFCSNSGQNVNRILFPIFHCPEHRVGRGSVVEKCRVGGP